jgi:hypothetical protein
MANRRSDPDQEPPQEQNASNGTGGEFRGGDEMGTAVISGQTFYNKSVVFYEVEGMAIVEGDIALGTVEEVREATETARETMARSPAVAFGVGLPAGQNRWPNCVMPYEIDPNLPNKQRVTDAIAHWEANTAFRFPLRTPANAASHPNYVRFTDAGGCWSLVGMRGGQQTISLGANCTTGNTIHEIGHAVGLWHEQSREDRDLFVTIHWQNIQSGMAAQFNQHIVDGDDYGVYDYGSVMHYPRKAFSKNGQDTIVPVDANAQIGQRTGLSAGDIAAVRAMYPECHRKQPWADPVTGTKQIADTQISVKKVRDDQLPVKKLRDDPIKGIRDPKMPRDPGPIKIGLDPRPVAQPTLPRPTVLRPFSLATPHHAPMLGGASGPAMETAQAVSYLQSLEQEILELDAVIAETNATSARANADLGRLMEIRASLATMYEELLNQLGGGH